MNRNIRINGVPVNGGDNDIGGHRHDLSQKVRDTLRLLKRHYPWFVVSVIICVAVSVFISKNTPDIYLRTTSIMIKDGENGGANISLIKDLGIDTSPQNVINEIMVIKSADVARQVVKRLGLEVEFRREGLLVNPLIYGDDVPIEVRIEGLDDNSSLKCTFDLIADSMVKMSDIVNGGQHVEENYVLELGKHYKTAIGGIIISPSDSYIGGCNERILLHRRPLPEATAIFTANINANLRSRDATIIDIYYTDESTVRADDILDAVVDEYNRRWVSDRNTITESTSKFINERISTIEKELSLVELSLADYRSSNLTLDADAQGEKALSRVEKADDRLIEIENQIYMIEYMRSFIEDTDNRDSPLPLNTGISSRSIEHYLAEYNSVMQTRNRHLAHSSPQNPLVCDLTENLYTLKSTILHTIENELIRLSNEYEIVSDRKLSAQATVATAPHQIIYLTSIERQKQVKENLYLFLLQKKEENELSRTFTAYNCRLVEPPHGPSEPIAPNPEKSCMFAIFAGLTIPLLVIMLREGMNGKVRTRTDVEWLGIPFMGEIPLAINAKGKGKKKNKASERTKSDVQEFLVMKHRRDVMNEAFRVLRTNIEFMLHDPQHGRIVMVTSLNPASGKTFIAANLALSLSLAGKRVVLVDLDMRKAMISGYVIGGRDGVSSYLSGRVSDIHNITVSRCGLDVIPCGEIPPNPTELLITDAFTCMISYLKNEYDYVVIDSPPVELVADAAIINQCVDLTLFVVRAHLHEKAHLPYLDSWHAQGRYRNLALVLNGTTIADSVYGKHGYGYC